MTETREMRGVRGKTDDGKFTWVRLYEHDETVELYVTGHNLHVKPETARKLAEHLNELADMVEFRDAA